MKLAAAENVTDTTKGAGFSIGIADIKIPDLLSFLATGDPNGTVQGINDLQKQYQTQYGPGDYSPIVPVTFWSFRLMIGAGTLAVIAALWFLWRLRRGNVPGRGAVAIAALLPFLPLAANSFAWLFTEIGRQPWIVYGQQLTSQGVSPSVSSLEVLITVVGFTALYGGLAIVEVGLLLKKIRADVPAIAAPADGDSDAGPLPFAY